MRLSVLCGPLTGLVLLFAACPKPDPGPEDGGQNAGEETISPVELCERIASARCDLLSRCYRAFARQNASDCRLIEQSRCLDEYTRLRPSFEADKVAIDVAQVTSCERRLRTSACVPTFPPGDLNVAAAPFSDCTLTTGLLEGKVPAGETCDESVECAQGTVCVKPNGVCTGTCSSLALEGEPCSVGCAEGLYCNADGVCAAPKGLNEPCDSSAECAQDLWCDGVCKQRGSVGDACRFDPLRLSTCAPGLACDVVPFFDDQVGTCIVPLGQGEHCRYHWSCAPGLVCWDLDWSQFPIAPPPEPGTCAPPAPAGLGCSYTPYSLYVGDVCESGTSCDPSGLCSVQPTLGEACNPFSQACAGKDVYCKPSETVPDKGTCTTAAAQNERCATQLDDGSVIQIPCESGFCDSETTLKCRPPDKQLGQECGSDGECLSGRCALQEDRTFRCANACL
ncbi:MAG: hypothetical protein IRZ16_20350 [Myxococcaceae bacterium]|nr:hypothetical protein [Myxococcaceae bacterium]